MEGLGGMRSHFLQNMEFAMRFNIQNLNQQLIILELILIIHSKQRISLILRRI